MRGFDGEKMVEGGKKGSSERYSQEPSKFERIISESEASGIAEGMVRSARSVLNQDWHFNSYKRMLGKMLTEKNFYVPADGGGSVTSMVEKASSEMQNMITGSPTNAKSGKAKNPTEMMYALIDEVLRFLALKILVTEYTFTDPVKEGREDELGNRSSRRARERAIASEKFRLIPSEAVSDAWKALLLLPVTYVNVCKAMGCSFIIDYNEDDYIPVNDPMKFTSEIDRHSYRWTADTYLRVFKSTPPSTFWPSLTISERELYEATRSLEKEREDVFSFSDFSKIIMDGACGSTTKDEVTRS